MLFRSHFGSALLCDTVIAYNSVAVLCSVILSVPLTMWQWSVVTERTGTTFNDVICKAECSCENTVLFSHWIKSFGRNHSLQYVLSNQINTIR